jgi:hypothetical protein
MRSNWRSTVCRDTATPSPASSPAPARPAKPAGSLADLARQPGGAQLIAIQHARDLLAERLHRAIQHRAPHPPHPDPHHHRPSVHGHVRQRLHVIPVHMAGQAAAPRARHRPPAVRARRAPATGDPGSTEEIPNGYTVNLSLSGAAVYAALPPGGCLEADPGPPPWRRAGVSGRAPQRPAEPLPCYRHDYLVMDRRSTATLIVTGQPGVASIHRRACRGA